MHWNVSCQPAAPSERDEIAQLMQAATVEMTVHDVAQLDACRAALGPDAPVYVSFLPKQDWDQTVHTAAAVRAAGLEPIPHVPVRRLENAAALERLLRRLTAQARVTRLLLIAGDTPAPRGPFASTLDVLHTGVLTAHGIGSVMVAGHPEGHPSIAAPELRAAEQAKVEAAEEAGLELGFLTQFGFSAGPIRAWIAQLRARGIRAPVVAGLAGPARLGTLIRYATLCGVGPSLRALTAHAGSLPRLTGTRGPEPVVRALARARRAREVDLAGVHFFAFGGLARTCAWMQAAAAGRFELDDQGFRVAASDRR